MNHLNEEELIAHAYAEDDQDGVQQHLEACAECAKTYTALRGDLAEMKFAEAPVAGRLLRQPSLGIDFRLVACL